ncbi:DNA-3-methyladenine glycosylase [Spiroplasma chrysopicola]|uniref:Putative 3-methyladenine DNA glycosylase n=1 Tax=Spiroplasma chrysopicola DF-1 TaxID=1276227 RepID=R4U2P4_9MOLU|nr:DNA-3-methyladenine glycosylase [Spiroplasma chrysopicola]AGM24738.1 3-methyladenine DNA glycosylase [Spiroplasma chrysopicola DF-1]
MINFKNRITAPTFFTPNACTVAEQLLGKYLVRVINNKRIVAKIVEVEAYDGAEDDANHGFNNRRTVRNEPLFWSGGFAHVFLIYGCHNCFNVITDQNDIPSAVLIRAGEIIIDERDPNFVPNPQLANGPGKFSRYLAIDRGLDRVDLRTSEEIYLIDNLAVPLANIIRTQRINVDYATNYKSKPYRFYIKDNKAVSKG